MSEPHGAQVQRLFFALWPPPAVAAQLEQAARDAQLGCGGRRARRENLHLTLAFLGDVAPARLDDLYRLADDLRGSPAALTLDQLGYWKHNRILWAGGRSLAAELAEFAARLNSALALAGHTLERRPFAAHMTLLRDARPPRMLAELAPLEWRVDEFRLVASHLHAGGPRYESLRAWRL